MKSVIEVRELVKRYGDLTAVDGISFEIEGGTCFGLLGPNGAGKTTTVEIMEGVGWATSGRVLYEGAPIGRAFKQVAGIQFQTTALQDYLTVREVLHLFRSFYRRLLAFDVLVELCALDDLLDREAKKLSGGQRQRVLLALALVNDPKVVFLDEPTTGLDPQARRNFWQLVRTIKARGATVILTTHYMEEAYTLCDELIILDRGHIIAQGSPQALLREQFEGLVVELPVRDFTVPKEFPWPTHQRDGAVEIQTTDVNATLSYLMGRNVSLVDLRVKSRTLEDLFLELTGEQLRG